MKREVAGSQFVQNVMFESSLDKPHNSGISVIDKIKKEPESMINE